MNLIRHFAFAYGDQSYENPSMNDILALSILKSWQPCSDIGQGSTNFYTHTQDTDPTYSGVPMEKNLQT